MARAFCLNALPPRSTSTTLALSRSSTGDMAARVLHRSPAVACIPRYNVRSVPTSGAADPVAPSPRAWGGEREGVRGTPVERVSAPHPSPLPVKNGEREQTEYAALLSTPDAPRFTAAFRSVRNWCGRKERNPASARLRTIHALGSSRSFRAALPPRARSPCCGGFRHFRYRPDRPLFTTRHSRLLIAGSRVQSRLSRADHFDGTGSSAGGGGGP